MTWKKRQDHVMDGDICEPSEWRINNNEFASEFNGFLDSDNINAGSLNAEHVKRDTFTKVLMNQSFSYFDYIFSHKRSGYSSQPDYQALARPDMFGSPSSEFDGAANWNLALEGQFVIDSFDWTIPPTKFKDLYGGDIWTHKINPLSSIYSRANESDPDHECRLPYYKFKTEGDALLIIDFTATVQQLHAFTLNNVTDFYNWVVYKIFGWIGLSDVDFAERAGRIHVNSIGYPYRAKTTHNHPQKNALILCSIWRILVDGRTVCKTGMIGPELESHPIYLTGAVPVTSGEHTIELQGKTCWYCPTSGKQYPSNSIDEHDQWTETLEDATTDAASAITGFSYEQKFKEKIRKDISLRQPNLIVQIRSR